MFREVGEIGLIELKGDIASIRDRCRYRMMGIHIVMSRIHRDVKGTHTHSHTHTARQADRQWLTSENTGCLA